MFPISEISTKDFPDISKINYSVHPQIALNEKSSSYSLFVVELLFAKPNTPVLKVVKTTD